MTKVVEPLRMRPQLAQHTYRQFGVMVPATATKAALETSEFWQHVARGQQAGDEIRCLAEDGSFVAYVLITFVAGNDVRAKVLNFVALETVESAPLYGDYEVKNGGIAGFYIKDKRDGSRLFNRYYKSQREAIEALEGHLKALAA